MPFAVKWKIGIAVLLLGVGLTSSASGQSSDDRKRARVLFDQAVALSDEGRWSEALTAYQESDRLVASASVRYNIAATLRALGRYVEARRVLQRIVEQQDSLASRPKPELKQSIQTLLEEVQKKIVVAHIRLSPADAALQIDGIPVTLPPDARVELDPGRHVFVAKASQYDTTTLTRVLSSRREEVEIRAPRTKIIERQVVVEKPATDDRTVFERPWFWTVVGLAIAAGVVTTVLVTRTTPSDDAKPPPVTTLDRMIPVGVRF